MFFVQFFLRAYCLAVRVKRALERLYVSDAAGGNDALQKALVVFVHKPGLRRLYYRTLVYLRYYLLNFFDLLVQVLLRID